MGKVENGDSRWVCWRCVSAEDERMVRASEEGRSRHEQEKEERESNSLELMFGRERKIKKKMFKKKEKNWASCVLGMVVWENQSNIKIINNKKPKIKIDNWLEKMAFIRMLDFSIRINLILIR